MYNPDYFLHESYHVAQYRSKNIKDWDSEDCLQWAADTERELCIPISSCLTLGNFGKVTGRDLRRYKEEDFKRLVNDMYGPLFFRTFRRLVKERKEEAASNKVFQPSANLDMNMSTNFMDIANWTVPQMRHELEAPTTDYGNAYQASSPCLSPSFSLGSEDSLHRREEHAPTYFTQPAMLSGGSLSYGTSAGTMQSLDDSSLEYFTNDQNYSSLEAAASYDYDAGCSTLLPDFNSLMIQDGVDSFSDHLDITELESSLEGETFSDLDQLIHGGATEADIRFEDEAAGAFQPEYNLESTFSVPANDSLEESMLKKIPTGKRGNRVRHPQSWEFLIRLLLSPQTNPSLIKWEDKENGVFRLVQKEEIAKLWGKRSQKHKSDPLAYDNFARIIRYHYRSKVLLPVSDKHLVYKLGDKVMEKLRKADIKY